MSDDTPAVLPFHHCIVCDRPLKPSMTGESLDIPRYPATHFTACGNYGSTLFDPGPYFSRWPRERLEIVICDWCLTQKAQRVRLLMPDNTEGDFVDSIKGFAGPGDSPEQQVFGDL